MSISLLTVTTVMKLKTLDPWKESYDKPREHIKQQTHHFANKGPYSQNYSFSRSHGCKSWDQKEGWEQKNWCFWIVVLEKTPEISLHYKNFKLVNPKGNQPWIFIGRTYFETQASRWPLDVKSRLIGKHPDAGKDWRQRKGALEDEMVR